MFFSSANPLTSLLLFCPHLHSAKMSISCKWDILYTKHYTHHRVCMRFDHFPIWEELEQCLDAQVNIHSCVLGLSGHFLLRRRPPGCCPAQGGSSRSQFSAQSEVLWVNRCGSRKPPGHRGRLLIKLWTFVMKHTPPLHGGTRGRLCLPQVPGATTIDPIPLRLCRAPQEAEAWGFAASEKLRAVWEMSVSTAQFQSLIFPNSGH